MPILHGDQLIGRLDPKLERQQARLSINAVYFEPDIPLAAEVVSGVVQAINELGDFVGASEIVYGEPVPPPLRVL